MLRLIFSSVETSSDLRSAVSEYESIWNAEGGRISEALEKVTGNVLNEINAIIHRGPSSSGVDGEPLFLRFDYPRDTKLATLIHELSHRYIDRLAPEGWDSHQVLNLFLYDVWSDLYSKEFADNEVEVEKKRGERYQKSWDWALKMTRDEREEKLREVLK